MGELRGATFSPSYFNSSGVHIIGLPHQECIYILSTKNTFKVYILYTYMAVVDMYNIIVWVSLHDSYGLVIGWQCMQR